MTQEALDLHSFGEPLRTGLRDRVLLLRSFENLEGLDEEGFTLLAEHAVSRTYRKGEVLVEEGAAAQTIGMVVEGQVTVAISGKGSLVVRRGQGFGVLRVMAELPASRTVADEDTRVLEIPVPAFRIAIEENFSLLRNALRFMSRALTRLREHLPADPANPPKVELGEYFERPRTLVEQLIELRKGPFVQMNIDALVDLARRMVEIRVPAGHVLWSVGEQSTHAIHVEYGRVRCTAADGRHIDVGHDYTLGAMDAWSNALRSYEVRAETPVIAYRIDYEDFLVICEMHASVGLDMLRGIARQYVASPGVSGGA